MMIEASTQTSEIAKARSVAYGLIACTLREPEDGLIRELGEPERWHDWPVVIQDMDTDLGYRLADLKHRIASCGIEELREAHLRLFGHTVRGAVPPYELEYGQGEINQQTSELADINGFYSAFGVEMVPGEHERADHVSIESEFMSVLAAKEAYALAEENEEAYQIVRHAAHDFLQDHLGRWLPSFARRIEDRDPQGFYGAAARFALAFVAMDCQKFDIEVAHALLALRPANPAVDAGIDCGLEQQPPGARSDSFVQVGIDPSLGGSAEGGDLAD